MDRRKWLAMQAKDPLTSLLLHMDGADGAANFIDSSPYAHGITATSPAQISTAQSKFGGASLLLDGSTGDLRFSASDRMDFGTGDFTIDFWVRFSTDPASGLKVFIYGTATGDIGLFLNGTIFTVTRNGIANDMTYSPHGLTTGTWYHIAVCRTSGSMKLFIDGVLKKTQDTSGLSYKFSGNSYIGAYSGGGRFPGNMEEVRIRNGEGVWTSGFTPPVGPYAY